MVRKSRASVDIVHGWSLTYVGVGESVRCHFGVADRSLDHGPRADVLSRAREGGEPDASENGYLEKKSQCTAISLLMLHVFFRMTS